MNAAAVRIALAAVALVASACNSSQVCVPNAEQMACRCGDGTDGYLTCNASGTYADPDGIMHCICDATLSPDGSATLPDADTPE